jgi:hypothetical protein
MIQVFACLYGSVAAGHRLPLTAMGMTTSPALPYVSRYVPLERRCPEL